MNRNEYNQIESLIADLRRGAKASAGDAAITFAGAQAQALADELSRLLQSSNRLRQQNAKLRRRIERLKAGLADTGEEAGE